MAKRKKQEEKGGQMTVYKRNEEDENYSYRFMFNGTLVRKSTNQGNYRVAREMEAAHKTSLAKCEAGFREKDRTTLSEFMNERFQPWAKDNFENKPTKTWRGWYQPGIRALQKYPILCNRVLSEITSEHVSAFAAHIQSTGRRGRGLQVSSVNSRLRVLRRIFHLAVKWKALEVAPQFELLSGECHRERVLKPKDEARYLAAASPLLADIATLLVDSGMRPEECFRQCWENVTWVNGRHGSILVTHGKTKAARRSLPMTPRVRAILERRWKEADESQEGWIWPAPTKSGHVEPSTLKKQHRNAIKTSKVVPFVLYTLRHTFLTRLGESGCDVWTLARIAGHSSIAMSMRYVHPSEDCVLDAMTAFGGKALTGHKIDHSE
jgi:integrase